MDKKIIILNSSNFNDLEGFYNEIDRLLTKNLSWKTGHNLDALNDLLRGGFGVYEYEEPVIIIWENANKSKEDLGYKETIKHYENMLLTCHPTNRDSVKELLERAKQNQGDTLFDIIVGIMKEHDHIEFKMK